MKIEGLYASYFRRDIGALESSGILPEPVLHALRAHWSGDLNEALRTLEAFRSGLQFRTTLAAVREFVEAEYLLLNAKVSRAGAFEGFDSSRFYRPEAKYIAEYARFSLAFWIDHRIARSALWRLLRISLSMREQDATLMVLFLMAHLSAIAGLPIGSFQLARYLYNRVIRHIAGVQAGPSFFQNIVLAAFPYTIFVSNQIGHDLNEVLQSGESLLPFDPYYRSLFTVSGLYCYAYSGDITRTELYVKRLESGQTETLSRYRPVSKIMHFLPFTMRGYGFLIARDFNALMASKANGGAPALINSQFYRTAAIIYLSLGEFEKAQEAIQMAVQERRKTQSFHAWEPFDSQIADLAKRQVVFRASTSMRMIQEPQTDSSQFAQFFVDFMALPTETLTLAEDEFYEKIREKLSEHLGHEDIGISEAVSDIDLTKPAIRFGNKYYIFNDVPAERVTFIRSILSSLGPIAHVVMNAHDTQKRAQEYESLKSTAEIAAQVSHDIRSPLSALNMITHSLSELPEQKRLIIRNATQRINDIANGLSSKSRAIKNMSLNASLTAGTGAKPDESIMLIALLDNIISEKRVQYRQRMEVEILGDLHRGYGLFAKVNPTEFARAISNLINNSVEAFEQSGRVFVEIFEREGRIVISIRDNGRGMSSEVLAKIGRRGVSFGKDGIEGGTGLGVYHATQVMKEAGGDLAIESSVGVGTSVMLTLPKAEVPKWFVSQLRIKPSLVLVSVDDDQTIHQVWAGRLAEIKKYCPGIRHVTFTSLEVFSKWVMESKDTADLFLVDYEFLGQDGNGLTAIERTGINEKAILVTSRYEDRQIRDRAKQLGVRILPKALAPFVPFIFERGKMKDDAALISRNVRVQEQLQRSVSENGLGTRGHQDYPALR